jgi:hypothetical protein
MTVTARTACTVCYGIAAGLLTMIVSAAIALPTADAAPQQQCDTTVGQSASQTVKSYLDKHPDVKQELTAKGEAEASGSGVDPLLDYLANHPDVRQALITLANQCA